MEHDNGAKMVYKVTNKGTTFLDYYEQMMHLLPMTLEENSEEESLQYEITKLDLIGSVELNLRRMPRIKRRTELNILRKEFHPLV